MSKDFDIEKIWKHIEKKMSKEEVFARLQAMDNKINKVESAIKEELQKIGRVEVRLFSK